MTNPISPLKGFSLSALEKLVLDHFGLQGTLQTLPGELDINAFLETNTGDKYILKIAHSEEDQAHVEMQNAMMQHLEGKLATLELPRVIANVSGENITMVRDEHGQSRLMRLLSWVEGDLWAKVNPHSHALLESLGQACGKMSEALLDFDHPAAHRHFKWNLLDGLWIKEHLDLVTDKQQRATLDYFIQMVEQEVHPRLHLLRRSVVYNDSNDYNILLSKDATDRKVIGLIDFGDAVHTLLVSDIAIAAAYACMDKPDPLSAAAHLVKGFHEVLPFSEDELAVIFPLIALRLCVSVINSAQNKTSDPENTYLQVSEQPAWDLLEKLRTIPAALAHYTFRHHCGLEACPKRISFDQWIATQPNHLGKVVDADWSNEAEILDLSIGSLELGNNANFDTLSAFELTIQRIMLEKRAKVGLGGYAEIRPFYSTDAYLQDSNEGPRWRTVHLGLDVWMPNESLVFSPLDGIVHSVQNNSGERDYGPTVIIAHKVSETLTFYTLYGHLSRRSLSHLYVGQKIEKGEIIATVGHSKENGGWPPHLHFQVILDLLGWKGDFPGVAFPDEQAVWLSICPNPAELITGLPDARSKPPMNNTDIIAARREHLGKNLSISYHHPLHMQRGFLQYLYDINGRRYLDTVNNVPHVGHQHPRVVQAAQRQLAILNTNTRYLHENIIHFAAELLATFPPELSVCYFVNSGSEANELAIRMAKTYSGQSDMIALEAGYHGNTGACVDVSAYKFNGKGGKGAPPHTQVVPMPDTYRGLYREANTGEKYAAFVEEAVQKVQGQGRNIAGFICESILSCGGQIVLPPAYLETAYQTIRAAGGLCIADEVQVGLGRVGSHFWGFELQGVVPDIVTIGKPIGNGHPLAAVVTTQAVADAFTNGMEYFNTFGGNPVSCAIGREVLQVVKEEKLQDNALQIGKYLLEGLQQLQNQYPIIGDVRGQGLFLGFELVKDPTTLAPAPEQATYLANRMRERGILMSTDGPLHNVLKIKPPMCFNQKNAAFFLAHLETVLGEDVMKI
ncbi:MAG: aminotransferase class III-fold pyridoxal phosphate-dependent enzyme [Saprospiraceae bacterium]